LDVAEIERATDNHQHKERQRAYKETIAEKVFQHLLSPFYSDILFLQGRLLSVPLIRTGLRIGLIRTYFLTRCVYVFGCRCGEQAHNNPCTYKEDNRY
jgi:hypothetical protein